MNELVIAPDHPAATGHFPGNPIIPGAWLLAAVVREIELAEGWQGGGSAVRSAKFFFPVRPGDLVGISYEVTAAQEVKFQASVADTRVLAGVIHAAGG